MFLFYGLTKKDFNPYVLDKNLQINYYKVEPKVQTQIDKIKANKKWLKQIKTKAGKENLPVPAMLEREARYMTNQVSFANKRAKDLILRIKQDSAWFVQVKKQAKERGISNQEMLLISAKFIMANDKKPNEQD
jgi:hypothetical protein